MKFLIYIITFSIIALSYSYLGKKAKITNLKEENGFKILHIHGFFKVFSIICLIFGIGISLGPWLIPAGATSTTQVALSFLGLVFIVIFFLLKLISNNHFLKFNDQVIQTQTIFKKQKEINLRDIVKASHNGLTNAITFKDSNGKKLSCSQFLVGIVNLLETIEVKNNLDLKKVKQKLQFIK